MRYDSFLERVEAVFTSWEESKLFVEHFTDVSTESLHLIIGVMIQLVAAGLLRRPVSAAGPWLVVLAFTIINEVVDLAVSQWPHPGMQFGEGVKDIVVTMFLPSVLLFAARKTPGVFTHRVRSPPPPEDGDTPL